MPKELVNYICDCRKNGFKDRDVRSVLMKQGHKEERVDDAFSIANKKCLEDKGINSKGIITVLLSILLLSVLNFFVLGFIAMSSLFLDPSFHKAVYVVLAFSAVGMGYVSKFTFEKIDVEHEVILRAGFFTSAIVTFFVSLAVFLGSLYHKYLSDKISTVIGDSAVASIANLVGEPISSLSSGLIIYLLFSMPFVMLVKNEERKLMPILCYLGSLILSLGFYYIVRLYLETRLLNVVG